MSKVLKNILGISLLGLGVSTLGVSSVAADYYVSITNETDGVALANAVSTLISSTHKHTLSYDELWDAYATTDCFPGTTKIWDTYSEVLYNLGKDQAGTYSKEGDAYNREHTVPQSWFSKNMPMKGDAFHVLATDGYVNNRRSSYVYGEVSSATYTSNNGSLLGSSKLSGYSGTVFEPIDEYKGDIARGCMYMAIRYKDQLGSWSKGEAKKVFQSSYPYLTSYARDLFAKWSHLDPVSDKEVIRNEEIEKLQGNRNPFIDHPEWVDVIWSNTYSDSTTKTKYSKDNVVSSINTLSTSSSDTDVYQAYAKYCRLNTLDKVYVSNASTLFELVEAKSNTTLDLDSYWTNIIEKQGGNLNVDEELVELIIEQIDEIPSTVTANDLEQVENVYKAYKGLNAKEKQLVTNYSKLESALKALEGARNQKEADKVIAVIDALPTVVTEADYDTVNDANNAYLALTEAQKALVTNYSKLDAALKALDTVFDQKEADKVIQLINDLPEVITEADYDTVNDTNSRYLALTASQKALVTNYSKLDQALNALDEFKYVTYTLVTDLADLSYGDTVIIAAKDYNYALGPVYSKYYREAVAIEKNGNTITLPRDTRVTVLTLEEGTKENSFAFNTGNGYLVPNESHKNLVTEANITVNSSYNIQYSASQFNIESCGSYSSGTIVFVKNKFTEFSSDVAVNEGEGYYPVSIYKVITSVEIDEEKVENVINLIDALPDTVTLSDEEDIFAIEDLYNDLKSNEKVLVTNYSKFLELKKEFDDLRIDITFFENHLTKSSLKFNYEIETVENGVEGYYLVTSNSELNDGDEIVIAAQAADKAFGPLTSKNVGESIAVTKNSNSLSFIGTALVFTIEKGTKEDSFYILYDSKYLTCTPEKNLSFKASKKDASEWHVGISTSGAATVYPLDKTNFKLQYNKDAPRFTTYKSEQSDIVFYKKTGGATTKASVSNAYLRFGGGMSLEHYSSLVAMGNTVTFGVALSKDGENYKHYACTPVRVNELGDKNPDPNGANLQYSVSFKVKEKDYDTLVYAKLYVEIDGVKYYAQEASYSMHTLAQYYLKYKDDFNLQDEIILALGEF